MQYVREDSMKTDSSTQSWGKFNDEWINALQNDIFRRYFITPVTLRLLGDVAGKDVLDIGCGEGMYSRELARRGARVIGVDCAQTAIAYCQAKAGEERLDITYAVRNSCDLQGIADNAFDLVLASMMLMDCEDMAGTVGEITRVLRPGGRLLASVLHPCFAATTSEGISRQGGYGLSRQVVVSNYYQPTQWEAPLTKRSPETVIWRHRTLEEYVSVFVTHGLTITSLHEPRPTPEQAAAMEDIAWLGKIPIFLFWELKK